MTDIAMVTGAAGAIGLACARRLAADGMQVAVVDLDGNKARDLARSLGSGHQGYACDISSEEHVVDVFDQIGRQLGPIRVVVNCAGLIVFPSDRRPAIVDTPVEDWERTFRVNAAGAFLVTREMMRCQAASPVADARLIHITSSGAQLGGYSGPSAYFASKGAVLSLVKAAARESAIWGMTVNSVSPGMIDTPMLRMALPVEKEGPALERVPLARIGVPEDISAAVGYLASRDAGYVTGAVLDVNGGIRMQ